jgi:hypothetical protein
MPVKLSDELVQRARKEAVRTRRSMTAQVEHWARIGQAAERSMPASVVERLRDGHRPGDLHPVVSFFERLTYSDVQKAAERKLALLKYPRYESDPGGGGRLFEVHADGRRIGGRWDLKKNRFVAGVAARRRA